MAHEAMTAAGQDRPMHLPMQALDQATGYLMATSAARERMLEQACRRVDRAEG
jgi:hypothetical protein